MNITTQLVIQKAANGFIVSVPFQPQVIRVEDQFRQQARILKDEFHSDPMLRPAENEDDHDNSEFKIESEPNVFVFKTMDELIAFLKTYL